MDRNQTRTVRLYGLCEGEEMKRKFIKSKSKDNTIDNIKLLALSEDVLQYILSKKRLQLTNAEFCEFLKAFNLMLDTAFFFLPYGERNNILEKLQNGEITPSQAEKKIFVSEGIPKPSDMKNHVYRGGKYERDYANEDKVDLTPYIDYL